MPVLFAVTLFVGATLLFLVQPMIAKMILPKLGGTPAVWNTCMVFFQAALLAGYSYAHATTAWLGVRRQALLQGRLDQVGTSAVIRALERAGVKRASACLAPMTSRRRSSSTGMAITLPSSMPAWIKSRSTCEWKKERPDDKVRPE